jgi:DNA-binding CsgD family transcriptional regulator
MRFLIIFCCFATLAPLQAQYHFSGYVDSEAQPTTVYLSVIENYRLLNGIYQDQIITKTTADSTGYFQFQGDYLDEAQRIYRIHSDNCADVQDNVSLNGFCPNSYAVVFIAKNKDTLSLPYGFEKQVFCNIESNNPRATALIKIDSIKEAMKFAYSEYPSAANKKLNDKKWFSTLQEFGKNTGEPLAELYAYAFLSNRSNETYRYYAEDLQNNDYYEALQSRLKYAYPSTTYAQQYSQELQADRFMLAQDGSDENTLWKPLLYLLLIASLSLNIVLFIQQKRYKHKRLDQLKSQLSKQEQVVLEQLLQDKSNKDIAESLFLSVSTVKSHTHSIYKKLKVQSRDQAKSLFTK